MAEPLPLIALTDDVFTAQGVPNAFAHVPIARAVDIPVTSRYNEMWHEIVRRVLVDIARDVAVCIVRPTPRAAVLHYFVVDLPEDARPADGNVSRWMRRLMTERDETQPDDLILDDAARAEMDAMVMQTTTVARVAHDVAASLLRKMGQLAQLREFTEIVRVAAGEITTRCGVEGPPNARVQVAEIIREVLSLFVVPMLSRNGNTVSADMWKRVILERFAEQRGVIPRRNVFATSRLGGPHADIGVLIDLTLEQIRRNRGYEQDGTHVLGVPGDDAIFVTERAYLMMRREPQFSTTPMRTLLDIGSPDNLPPIPRANPQSAVEHAVIAALDRMAERAVNNQPDILPDNPWRGGDDPDADGGMYDYFEELLDHLPDDVQDAIEQRSNARVNRGRPVDRVRDSFRGATLNTAEPPRYSLDARGRIVYGTVRQRAAPEGNKVESTANMLWALIREQGLHPNMYPHMVNFATTIAHPAMEQWARDKGLTWPHEMYMPLSRVATIHPDVRDRYLFVAVLALNKKDSVMHEVIVLFPTKPVALLTVWTTQDGRKKPYALVAQRVRQMLGGQPVRLDVYRISGVQGDDFIRASMIYMIKDYNKYMV